MGREVKRVALNFVWPLHKVWEGFLNPFCKFCHKCEECDWTGYSQRAKELSDMWYGHFEFNPESTGSKPFSTDHPVIKALATRNAFFNEYGPGTDIDHYWDFYDKNKDRLIPSPRSVEREAQRLCDVCYNNHWSHHLSQDDVDALVKNGRLMDFTHTWSKEKGWKIKNPPYHPTAKEVNEWSLVGLAHDGINQSVCVNARCKKEKVSSMCKHCKGHGGIWESKEYKKKFDKWKMTEPPTGPGYQIWETVSEGSPVSPVFEKPEDLANWMVKNDTSVTKNTTFEQWVKFIKEVKWAMSFVGNDNSLKAGTETI